jgi:selenide,water dikinase
MTRASSVDVEIDLNALPVLAGAQETVQRGILSSLQPANARLRRAIRNQNAVRHHQRYPLIFDPQTSGGLLASVPAAQAQSCLKALHDLGYAEAAIVGRVTARSDHAEPVTLIA